MGCCCCCCMLVSNLIPVPIRKRYIGIVGIVSGCSFNPLSFQIGVRAIVRHPREKLVGLRTCPKSVCFAHRSPRKDLLGGNNTIHCTITYPTIGQQHRIVLRNGFGTCRIVIALVLECLSGLLSHKFPWNTSSWSPVVARTEHVEIGSGCNLSMLLNL
jgi:hypothetical protein